MRKSEQVASWAVYRMTVLGEPGPNVVCYQSEWEAIERAQPGLHRLIKGGIANEGEAERLARGTSGDHKRAVRKRAILEFLPAEPAGPEERLGVAGEDDGPVMLPFPQQGVGDAAAPDGPPHARDESA